MVDFDIILRLPIDNDSEEVCEELAANGFRHARNRIEIRATDARGHPMASRANSSERSEDVRPDGHDGVSLRRLQKQLPLRERTSRAKLLLFIRVETPPPPLIRLVTFSVSLTHSSLLSLRSKRSRR